MPSSTTGLAAAFNWRATSATTPLETARFACRVALAPAELVSFHAQSAGRIRLADPPGGP